MVVSIFSPAKVNLFLAVTGRRPDGYHDLVSLSAPLDFGDELEATSQEPGAGSAESGARFTLACDDPTVPGDESNLVLKAARAFVAATGWTGGVDFKLTKRIPVGAGLGGGSSNAVAVLLALNRLAGGKLSPAQLGGLAACLGSDCALFLAGGPVVMRGRGERVEAPPAAAMQRLCGRRLLLFKPGFGIATPWAYGRMVARGMDYLPAEGAEAKLEAWLAGGAPAEELLLNNMEGAVFEKYPALPVLLGKIRAEFGVSAQMSGSGSACFALLRDDFVTAPLVDCIRQCWGPPAFIREARIA